MLCWILISIVSFLSEMILGLLVQRTDPSCAFSGLADQHRRRGLWRAVSLHFDLFQPVRETG
ncbi:hypothetical protein, partial [Flavonifractor plautii]|uniref:hypothetical protein n=1 Tax=Flavonifractor plautii TaxID=292800 RepID=UPI0022E431E5